MALVPFMLKFPDCWWILPVCASLVVARAEETPRIWTSQEGKTVEATLVEADGLDVRLRLESGSVTAVARDRLIQADREYVEQWLARRPLKLALPDLVGVPTIDLKVDVVMEDAANSRYVYRTPHFEFESQGRLAVSLAKEVGRSFEATYELVRALPWDIQPRPAEGAYFRATLFRNMDAYSRAGGLPGSAGSYFTHRKRLMVPFESIGLREVGSAFRMAEDFDTHVLVHELTHQLMHFWLPYLPQWVVEGTAEYTGNLPLKNGRFRPSEARNGLKEYMEFRKRRMAGGVPEPYSIERLFRISNSEWNRIMATDNHRTQRLYMTSYLLVYYFMHLDGKGDGERFARYMRASAGPCRQIEAYERELAAFKRRPEVKVHADGSFEHPKHLRPPAMPRELFFGAAREQMIKQNLQVLLDGRTEAQLMEEVRAAYAGLGIKL